MDKSYFNDFFLLFFFKLSITEKTKDLEADNVIMLFLLGGGKKSYFFGRWCTFTNVCNFFLMNFLTFVKQ